MESLYDIDLELQLCLDEAAQEAQENDGVLSDYLGSKLDNIQQKRDVKIGNICRFIKSLKSQANMIKIENEKLAKREKSASNKASSLTNYLSMFLNNGEKYSDSTCEIAWRKSTSVKIIDPLSIDRDFLDIKVIETPDKIKIKKALTNNITVNGAILETKQNIQIK